MGLDMYLYKKEVLDVYDFSKSGRLDGKASWVAERVEITSKSIFPDGYIKEQKFVVEKPSSSGELILPVAYWRKANAIHKWFVDVLGEEDECQKIYVSGKKLKELVDLCKKVLRKHKLASELLPTQSGFFFGSTQYDEYYFDDLKDTVKKLKDIDEDAWYIYQASW